ncbi:MAG: rhomboid family intramembrane serine protease [Phycisphaerae bacterium]
MIPIRDENPTHSTPYVTVGLIVLNSLIFLFQITRPDDAEQLFTWKYGFVPAQLVNNEADFRRAMTENAPVTQAVDRQGRPLFYRATGQPVTIRQHLPVDEAAALPAWLNIFTCMFLHGGWMHLIGNMLYLWIFGNNIEDKLGPVLFVVFYLGTGVTGNLAHTWAEAGVVPLIGASGAISGVMGAYVLLFPRAKVVAVVPAYFYWWTIKLPAWLFLGIYIGLQNLFPAFRGGQSNVAHWAHIGGFAAGAALIYLFPHRKYAAAPRPVYTDDDADIVI